METLGHKQNKLVSIIVPVYNMEQFLRRCLDSIIEQTYKNLEIILINDGSTDNTQSICEQYAQLEKRIVFISKENGGIADAFNVGLKQATGDFIVFVDSDDYIEKDMIFDLINNQIKTDADIVQTGMNIIDENGEITCKKIAEPLLYINKKDLLVDFFTKDIVFLCLSCKLFKKSLFDGYSFEKGRNIVDILATPQILLKCSTYYICDGARYVAFFRHDSVSRGKITDKTFSDLFHYLEVWNKLVSDNGLSECNVGILYRFCYEMAFKYPYVASNKDISEKTKKKKEMIRVFRSKYILLKKTTSFKKIPFRKRIVFKSFYFCPFLTYLIFKIKLRGKL